RRSSSSRRPTSSSPCCGCGSSASAWSVALKERPSSLPASPSVGSRRSPPCAPTGQGAHGGERREPTLGEAGDEDGLSFSATDHALADEPQPQQGELDVGLREELERLGATLAGERKPAESRSKLAGQAASIVDALRAPSSTAASAPVAAPPAPPAAG